jgi:NAD(P)-dependent dehydrogenase (short-subunit alcohol dehydrogenase family)
MMQQRSGTIINIASVAGIAGGMTLSPPYAASKAAVINLTKVAAAKMAEYGVTVNAVAPGLVDTAFNRNIDEEIGVRQMGLAPGEHLRRRADGIPLARISRPEDVSNVVAFLASPDACYITGETIVVSGGLVMR